MLHAAWGALSALPRLAMMYRTRGMDVPSFAPGRLRRNLHLTHPYHRENAANRGKRKNQKHSEEQYEGIHRKASILNTVQATTFYSD
jgi:hypothetical protein